MKLTHVAVVALALVLVGAGAVAAVPASDQANGNANDDANAPGAPIEVPADGTDDAAANESDAADRRGPPADLPAPVPDFVGDVHDAIANASEDAREALGEIISGLTPGGADADNGANPGQQPADGSDGTAGTETAGQ